MGATFLSAKTLSKSLSASNAYLTKRKKDYKAFCESLEFGERDGCVVCSLSNGKEIFFHEDGQVSLVAADETYGMMFASWKQCAAYYLASHG